MRRKITVERKQVGLVDQLCCLPADVYAGMLFVLAGIGLMLVLDPAVLVRLSFSSISTASAVMAGLQIRTLVCDFGIPKSWEAQT